MTEAAKRLNVSEDYLYQAVIGAAFGFSRTRNVDPTPPLTRLDLIVTIGALIMVRILALGIRLAH